MRILKLLLLILFPLCCIGQHQGLELFENLIGKTWKAEGNWSNGSKFFQEIAFTSALEGSIIISESTGFLDSDQQMIGMRNHGIRQYNKESETVTFWEFDVFGTLTKGIVLTEENNLIYQYNYGESVVTDMWEYQNDSTYNFIVGEYKDGQWIQTYLTTQFKEVKDTDLDELYSVWRNRLVGRWTSSAWDGQLDESWSTDQNGELYQTAEYRENKEVLFASSNKMVIVNGEIILFSVIKGNNPKIFKATSWSDNSIVFENSDYKNPNKVTYEFISNQEMQRTISGTENQELSTYTFKFKKLD